MSEWISVKDRLPPRNKRVLVYGKPDIEFYVKKYSGEKRESLEKLEGVWEGRLERKKKLLSWDEEPNKPVDWAVYRTHYDRWIITHWMPIPDPPEVN